MSSIRVQIQLKYVFDENSSKSLYRFWYGFESSKIRTIEELVQDIQVNYLKPQLSSISDKNEIFEENSVRIDLDGCQLLPFTSSEILRDNDQLIFIPISKHKLYKKALEDSTQLSSTRIVVSDQISKSSTVVEKVSEPVLPPVVKTIQVQPMESEPATESTITVTESKTQSSNEQQRSKKLKVKNNEEPMIVSPAKTSIVTKEKTEQPQKNIETTEAPVSLPSIVGRMKEIKSKTAKWKEQKPVYDKNEKNKLHIRFGSESEGEIDECEIIQEQIIPSSTIVINQENEPKPDEPKENEPKEKETSPVILDSSTNSKANEPKKSQIQKRKTLDLLLEMKQFKCPEEQRKKKVRQEIAKTRSQHRKRALLSLSMGKFIDNAFGLTQSDVEISNTATKQSISGSSTPNSLPASFSKMARLPLVAQAIESNDKIYDLYPTLNRLPSVNNRIAFKFLQLAEDFCPKLSEFKEGTVLMVDENNNELTIELDQPLETAFSQPSKFYVPTDELSNEDNKTVVLQFSELHSLRLLSTIDQQQNSELIEKQIVSL